MRYLGLAHGRVRGTVRGTARVRVRVKVRVGSVNTFKCIQNIVREVPGGAQVLGVGLGLG